MKALDVTEFYSERGGGVRSHLTHKGRVSHELGHAHVVVAPGPRDFEEHRVDTPSASEVAPRVIRIAGPPLPYDPTYHLLWRADKVRSIARRERPDVLEIDSPYLAAAASLLVPRRAFGVRTFFWHADFIDTYLRSSLSRTDWARGRVTDVALEPLWAWVRTIARRCDATFVASRWLEEKLSARGVPRVVRLPFGVERAKFSPAARDDRARRALTGGRDDVTVLLGVGRLAVEKQWEVVLRAFEAVRRERRCRLVLLGDGPERAAIEAHAAALGGDLHGMGFVRDRARFAALVASADVLVHGCPFETFGLSVAEALSCGLPVVVPGAGGAAELADGACGELYAPGDAADCARAVLTLIARLDADPNAMRDAALAAAARLPDIRAQFARNYEAYAELLSSRG